MGVPTSEVGYTSTMPRREDHEVRQGHVGHWMKKQNNPITDLDSPSEFKEVEAPRFLWVTPGL